MKLKVKDMSCNHCVMKIQKSLLVKGVKAEIDLSNHIVDVKLEKDVDKAIEAIKEAGYTAEK